ncbi:MAG TPA: DNA oxidative demethylase AlkB [Hyphomicrobiaceae bacterium]|nr:DNA oxidative demethylase AlkB [Hyphomicrobiaceae bacterium]
MAAGDLFASSATLHRTEIAPGAVLLHGFAADRAELIIAAIDAVASAAPFRNMITPGGHTMSVAMTSTGRAGWITDRRGYRYSEIDPDTGRAWLAMPAPLHALAVDAAATGGFPGSEPDSCLVNRYVPGARMSLHQDRDEADLTAPIVSVSLGLPAKFLFGGLRRADRPQRLMLAHGDVVVWGGPSRLAYHGIDPVKDGKHPLTGRCRINLTFRKAL